MTLMREREREREREKRPEEFSEVKRVKISQGLELVGSKFFVLKPLAVSRLQQRGNRDR